MHVNETVDNELHASFQRGYESIVDIHTHIKSIKTILKIK